MHFIVRIFTGIFFFTGMVIQERYACRNRYRVSVFLSELVANDCMYVELGSLGILPPRWSTSTGLAGSSRIR